MTWEYTFYYSPCACHYHSHQICSNDSRSFHCVSTRSSWKQYDLRAFFVTFIIRAASVFVLDTLSLLYISTFVFEKAAQRCLLNGDPFLLSMFDDVKRRETDPSCSLRVMSQPRTESWLVSKRFRETNQWWLHIVSCCIYLITKRLRADWLCRLSTA